MQYVYGHMFFDLVFLNIFQYMNMSFLFYVITFYVFECNKIFTHTGYLNHKAYRKHLHYTLIARKLIRAMKGYHILIFGKLYWILIFFQNKIF